MVVLSTALESEDSKSPPESKKWPVDGVMDCWKKPVYF